MNEKQQKEVLYLVPVFTGTLSGQENNKIVNLHATQEE